MADTKLSKLQKKSIRIKVDGESYYLSYDLNALVALENEYGDIEQAFEFDENPKGAIGKLLKVLFVGLQANHKDISELDVGAIFTMENLADFQEAVGRAMNTAMPEQVVDDEENPRVSPKDHLPKAKTKA